MPPAPGDDRKSLLRQLGARVASLRESRGFTQAQLAAQIGRATNSVSRWETAVQEMGILDARALAHALGTTVQGLLAEPAAPALLRSEPIYFVSPERMQRVQVATTHAELLELLPSEPPVGVCIEPGDVQVSAEQFHAAQARATATYRERATGPLRRLLAKLRGR